MDFDNTAALDARDKLPPPPPKAPERSAWGAIPRGVAGAAAQIGADAASFLRATGTAGAIAAEGDAGIVGVMGQDAVRAGADEARRRLREGTEFDSAFARQARDYERSLRPDAATASTAEQVVYSLTRGLTKAVGSVATAGPVGGAAIFGGSEAAATYDDLTREGVDSATAGKAAAVAGVANAAGVLLPMAGPTLKATVGLYAIGGPGGFMAQQAATREILRNANYAAIAERYDPTDMLGLGLAAGIPLPFAGAGALRNIRAAKAAKAADVPPVAEPTAPVAPDAAPRVDAPEALQVAEPPRVELPQETIDAAMVHNLTVLQDAADAVRVAEPVRAVEAPRVDVPAEPARPIDAAPIEPARPVDPPKAPDLGPLTEAYNAARAQMDGARTEAVPKEVSNIIAGLREAADDPRRIEALVRNLAREAAIPGKSPADATADAVQSTRALTEQDLAGTQKPQKPQTPDALRMVDERVKKLEAEKANMPVRVTEDGQTVTVADEMARVRREIDEGSDVELGRLDADLVKVAAECALSLGA